ncbi:MAG: hypothetical protein JSS49_07435 [Planctomycetes bacterium]|nr:hypothetical protein [Planctomycetota bacterium]
MAFLELADLTAAFFITFLETDFAVAAFAAFLEVACLLTVFLELAGLAEDFFAAFLEDDAVLAAFFAAFLAGARLGIEIGLSAATGGALPMTANPSTT